MLLWPLKGQDRGTDRSTAGEEGSGGAVRTDPQMPQRHVVLPIYLIGALLQLEQLDCCVSSWNPSTQDSKTLANECGFAVLTERNTCIVSINVVTLYEHRRPQTTLLVKRLIWYAKYCSRSVVLWAIIICLCPESHLDCIFIELSHCGSPTSLVTALAIATKVRHVTQGGG